MQRLSSMIFLIATFFLSLSSTKLIADLCERPCSSRFALQGAISACGDLSLGILHFTEKTEFGVSGAGRINNAHYSSKTFTPVIFGGLRASLCDGTYFAYGINVGNTFGTFGDRRIDYDVFGGPYISLEQMLTRHVMIVVWINPYQYQYTKLRHESSVSTQSYFSTGGIGLNYLF